MPVDLDPVRLRPVLNRLKRAQGQLAGLIRALEQSSDCEVVITQLAAVSRALDRAGFVLVAGTLEQCLAGGSTLDGDDARRLEKLFLSLA